MSRSTADPARRADLRPEIETIGGELRRTLLPVLESVAGSPPRPSRLARAVGLDKSLASRFVRAVMADSDMDLVHIVPSPEGLRILADQARERTEPALIDEFLTVADRFQHLLDNTPGGRATIDAHISEGSPLVRERSEQSARQAAFKSMSYLLGHFCETLSSSIFLVPAANGRTVDGIEVHRRIGLRRMRPNTPLALLSVYDTPEEGKPGDSVAFETIDGRRSERGPAAYLLPEFSSSPLPDLEVVRDGNVVTLVLGGDPSLHAPSHLASAFRVRNGWPVEPETKFQSLRGYVLHVPCRRLVRDVFVAEELFPGATSRVTFLLPGPRGSTPLPQDSGQRHFASVDLHATVQELSGDGRSFSLPGRSDHTEVLQHVLASAGHGRTRFRGWRCAIVYPVPMVEMMWWLVHPEAPRNKTAR